MLAHTGGEDQFPASTMFAFGESMKAGVDMLDLNVQLSHDGVLVVHHDDSVDGATNGTGEVADLDYAAIRALDDAYWFTADCVCKDRPASELPLPRHPDRRSASTGRLHGRRLRRAHVARADRRATPTCR